MKKTKGQNFIKKFINLREKDPYQVVESIKLWFNSHRIKYESGKVCEEKYFNDYNGLLKQFFGFNSYILHINPGKTNKIIIGKGVCFDSGGYDIKTHMADMFYDKNGALLSIAAAIENDVSCIVFFVNNMIRYECPVAGDILTDQFTGLRVLIDDTDAEGRIGLAHCIGLAKYLGYESILTIATLTGSAVQMTGERTYAMVHSDEPQDLRFVLQDVIASKSEEGLRGIFVGRDLQLWPAPFHEEYDKAIDTKIIGADVRSCGNFKGAGSSTAFSFLKRFSQDSHHIHLDMAAMMLDKNKNGLIFGLPEVAYLLNLL